MVGQDRELPPLLSVGDLTSWLRVSRSSVYGWVRQGLLPYLRLGKMIRFDRREVEAFVRRNPAAKDVETVRESQREVDRATGA
jgi:excisionase family DNA binding protein